MCLLLRKAVHSTVVPFLTLFLGGRVLTVVADGLGSLAEGLVVWCLDSGHICMVR